MSVFFVFKLVTFGVQLWEILAASGAFNAPPEVTAKALEMVDRVGRITAEDSSVLFLNQFLKAISLFVLGLMPAPKFGKPKALGRLGYLLTIVGIYGLVLQDTRYINQLAGWALQASPEFNSMVSCIAGRWCLIIIIVNLARTESALRNYSFPFYCLLYVLRVYQLAYTATSNLFPI